MASTKDENTQTSVTSPSVLQKWCTNSHPSDSTRAFLFPYSLTGAVNIFSNSMPTVEVKNVTSRFHEI